MLGDLSREPRLGTSALSGDLVPGSTEPTGRPNPRASPKRHGGDARDREPEPIGYAEGRGATARHRSSDRNDQDRAALEHHPANAASPRRAQRSRICLHLLIAGSPPPDTAPELPEPSKIRPSPGRQTSSHAGTQQDTTRLNQQVGHDQSSNHRWPAHHATKSPASRSGFA